MSREAVMCTRSILLLLILAWATLALPVVAQEGGRRFTTGDALDVRSVRVADVTEDGRWIAATIQTRRGRTGVDHTRFGDATYLAPSLGELLVIDAETGATHSLFDEPTQVRTPVWSPDGGRLAFFSREGDGYLLRVHDVASGRTRSVDLRTDKPLSSGSSLTWSPDGGSVLVALRPAGWAAEARQAFLEVTEGPVIVQDSRNDFLAWDRVRGLSERQIPALVTLRDGSVRELMGEVSMQGPRFSEDGQQLAYVTVDRLRTSYERAEGTEFGVATFDLEEGSTKTIMEPEERRLSLEWNETNSGFAYGKDGDVFVRWLDADSARNLTEEHRGPVSETDTTKLSYSLERWRSDGEALLVRSQQGYHVMELDEGSIELVLELEADEEVRPNLDLVGWSEDGRHLFLSTSAQDRWERGLLRVDVNARRSEDLIKDENRYGDWRVSEDGNRVTYRMSDGNRPDELYVADGSFGDVRRLTDLNPQLADVALTRTELIDYLDVDGNTLYGILYYPYGYEPGKQYPLVAEIYERFFENGYHENMNLVTAQGWFGFRPSVDLEIGYPGEAWLKAVPNAINKLIDRGLVDPDQVGVYGQSYGGYAVNLLVTQTDRFAAAANVSGKVNIISFLGDSPRITTRNYSAAEEGQDRIGATLWEQPHKYINTSAVMFADRIETPLLLLSGEGDWNVPATNQREMYYALRRLDKEVVWVNYVKGGHGAGRASTVEDFHDHWRRMFEWFAEHFTPDEEKVVSDGEQ
jgi:dipeptidyl aminopeptidase/acylaminoacyl peptidase